MVSVWTAGTGAPWSAAATTARDHATLVDHWQRGLSAAMTPAARSGLRGSIATATRRASAYQPRPAARSAAVAARKALTMRRTRAAEVWLGVAVRVMMGSFGWRFGVVCHHRMPWRHTIAS